MKSKVRTFFNLFLIAFFIGVIIIAYGYNPKARLIPVVISLPCLAMCIYQLISDLRGEKKKIVSLEDELFQKTMEKVNVEIVAEEKREGKTSREEIISLAKSSAWLMFFVLLVYFFGFLIAIPVFTVIFMRSSGDGWRVTSGVAFGLWVTIYAAFVLAAQLSLYDGLVFKLLE